LSTTISIQRRRFEIMVAEHTALIGRRIAEARSAKGLTQQGLGAEIPGKPGGDQVSKWERGIHRPGDDTLAAIAKATDRDIAWFHSQTPDKAETPDPFAAPEATDEPSVADRLATLERGIGDLGDQMDKVLTHLAALKQLGAHLHANSQLVDLKSLQVVDGEKLGDQVAARVVPQSLKAIEDYASRFGREVGKLPPRSRRATDQTEVVDRAAS
jgi:transcriptional regulator with XRE-family HTH domain